MLVTATKSELIVPASVRRRAGIKDGDKLEFKVSDKTITITHVNRTYTPTKSEMALIRKGQAEYARGEYLTLDEFLGEMESSRRKGGAKAGRKISR